MRVYGKLNLFLNVAEEKDGYHGIESVFAPCFDIFDDVTVSVCEKEEAGVVFSVYGKMFSQRKKYVSIYRAKLQNLSRYEDNTAKAVRLFSEKFGTPSVRVRVKKGIPFLAGMGGSSADAVGVLKCLCEMFGKDFEGVSDIVNQIGSDLAGMWSGGVNFCWGRGDKAVEIAKNIGGFAVVCTPMFGVSTRGVFAAFDKQTQKPPYFTFTEKDKNGGFDFVSAFPKLTNALENSAFEVSPELADFSAKIAEASGEKFLLTGSGSGMFCLVKTRGEAEEIASKIRHLCGFSAVTRL